jgi:hypothetical protein
MLTNLAVSAELFHTANGTAFADLMFDGHRETWPVRSPRFRSWLRLNITTPQVPPRALERSAQPSICLSLGPSLTRPSGLFTSASRTRMVASIWILPTTGGALLRLDPMGGASSPVRRSGSAGLHACCYFRCR